GLGEKGGRVAVIDGPAPGQDLTQVGGEDGGIELPLSDIGMRRHHLPPRFERGHVLLPVNHLMARSGPAAARSNRSFCSLSFRGPWRKRPMAMALSCPSGRKR